MYVVSAPALGLRPLQWFAISTLDGSLAQLQTPPRLNRTPYGTAGFYPELDGLLSPGGRYEVEVGARQAQGLDSSALSSYVRLIDHVSGQTSEVLSLEGDLVFKGCEWFPDETGGVLAIGPEFGIHLYILGTDPPRAPRVSELTGFEDVNLQEWTLSPDGTVLAIVDGRGALWALPLNGQQGSIIEEGFSYNVRWQPDGRRLFYYHGPEWFVLQNVTVYDIDRMQATTLVDASQLDGLGLLGRPFEVSPGGGLLAMWSAREIWLVEAPSH